MAQSELQKLVKTFLDRNPENGTRVLADKFGVSFPTIRRWAEGKNLPQVRMQPILSDFLRNAIEEK